MGLAVQGVHAGRIPGSAGNTEVVPMTLSLAAEPVPLRIDADGVVRVVGSRVTLDTIVSEFNDGACPEEIVHSFTTLKLADVYAIVAYYLRHQPEVDTYLCERERQAEEVRRMVESRPEYIALRERLLARRRERDGPSP